METVIIIEDFKMHFRVIPASRKFIEESRLDNDASPGETCSSFLTTSSFFMASSEDGETCSFFLTVASMDPMYSTELFNSSVKAHIKLV